MSRAKRIAVCGVFSALACVFLIVGAYLPTTSYAISVLAAVCVVANAVACPKNFGFCLMSYFVSTLVVSIITSRYLQVLPFALLFAPVCVAKYYFDGGKINGIAKWIAKIAIFEVGLAIYLLIYRFVFFETWQTVFVEPWYIWIVIVVAQLLFVLYDYALRYVFGWLKTTLPKMFKY